MKTMQPFDDVVETHGTTVLRVCASLLGPGPDAEDAWAETFLAALQQHPLADEVNVEAWLVRVARHKSVDILRKQRREHVTPPELVPTGVDEGSAQPQDLTFDDELWGEVAELSHRQRFVVAHRFIAQWTYPEIADALGCTPAAARRSGADAVATLRRRRAMRKDIR